MKTYATSFLVFCSFFGFVLYLAFAWKEWEALTNTKMSPVAYVRNDWAGFIFAVLLTVASYIVLPEVAAVPWFRETLGFSPGRTPMGAMTCGFLFPVLGYMAAAALKRRNGGAK